VARKDFKGGMEVGGNAELVARVRVGKGKAGMVLGSSLGLGLGLGKHGGLGFRVSGLGFRV
jgi:hypothetical protein